MMAYSAWTGPARPARARMEGADRQADLRAPRPIGRAVARPGVRRNKTAVAIAAARPRLAQIPATATYQHLSTADALTESVGGAETCAQLWRSANEGANARSSRVRETISSSSRTLRGIGSGHVVRSFQQVLSNNGGILHFARRSGRRFRPPRDRQQNVSHLGEGAAVITARGPFDWAAIS